jgi:predicted phosphodiesterase
MKPKKFVVVGDSHGDRQDDVTIRAVLDFVKEYNPEVRIHLGDAWDFRNLRRGASDDEKAASMAEDWEMGTDFVRSFFSGGKENHFLVGNHDTRLFALQESTTGVLRDYATEGVSRMLGVLKKSRAAWLPYDSRAGVLQIGHLKIVHGYFSGINACRQHATVYGNVIHGHTHDIQTAAVPSLEPAEARSIGALCNIDLPYAAKHTAKLRHSNGWCYGLLFPEGHYQLFQTRKLNDKFYAATEIKEL